MSKKKTSEEKIKDSQENQEVETKVETPEINEENQTAEIIEEQPTVIEVDPLVEMQKQLDESKDKYIRLSAEFDNFRKRTQREKMDLIRYGSEDAMKGILPLVDDFNRAIKSSENTSDIEALKQGLKLIQVKFAEFLKSNGVHEIEALGMDLDTDMHEAITKIPAPDEKLKGKIVDVVEKGYKLNDKVIRFSKVVIGE
jgi:molecular chaperone GrpE